MEYSVVTGQYGYHVCSFYMSDIPDFGGSPVVSWSVSWPICSPPLLRLQAAERAKEQAQSSSVTSPQAVADAWQGVFWVTVSDEHGNFDHEQTWNFLGTCGILMGFHGKIVISATESWIIKVGKQANRQTNFRSKPSCWHHVGTEKHTGQWSCDLTIQSWSSLFIYIYMMMMIDGYAGKW